MPPALATVAQIPVTMANGRPALLGGSIRHGMPTEIILWASWCGPCRREASKVAELRRRFDSDKLNLLYLNVRDDNAAPQDRAAFRADAGMAPDAYAVLDTAHVGLLTRDAVSLIPRTYVFDRAGIPAALIVGYKPLAFDRIAGLIDK